MIIYTYVSQRLIKKHFNNPGEKEHMYHVEKLCHTTWQNVVSQWIRQEREKQTKQSITRVESKWWTSYTVDLYCSQPATKQYNLEEEGEEIEAWFCLLSQPNVVFSPSSFVFFFTRQTSQKDHVSHNPKVKTWRPHAWRPHAWALLGLLRNIP
jgi:hypothetical protein